MRRTCRKSVVVELGKRDRFQREEVEWEGFGGDGTRLVNRKREANKTPSLND